MMKDKKKRVEITSFYDHTGIEKHLEKMAAKGWLLETCSSFFWTYRKIEPKSLRFSVTYFPMASDFDPVLSEEQQTFVDFCEEAGWHLAATTAQMQIFYSKEENPIPIETDALAQVNNIHRAMKRNFLPAHVVLLLVGILQGAMAGWSFHTDPIGVLANPFGVLAFLPWLLVVILCSAEIITYFRWHKRAKMAALEEGTFLPTRSTRKLQYAILIILAFYLVLWFINLGGGMNRAIGILAIVYMFLLLVLVNLLKYFLKKKQVSKNINRTITFAACFILSFAMIFLLAFLVIRMDRAGWFDEKASETYEHRGSTFQRYNDELPLVIEDLTGEEYPEEVYSYYADESSSVFLSRFDARQSPTLDHLGPPGLTYRLIQVKFAPAYDLCKNEVLHPDYFDSSDRYVSVDAAPWQAEEVYQKYFDQDPMEVYIVCWPDAILEINFDREPTEEQKTIVAEKLYPD